MRHQRCLEFRGGSRKPPYRASAQRHRETLPSMAETQRSVPEAQRRVPSFRKKTSQSADQWARAAWRASLFLLLLHEQLPRAPPNQRSSIPARPLGCVRPHGACRTALGRAPAATQLRARCGARTQQHAADDASYVRASWRGAACGLTRTRHVVRMKLRWVNRRQFSRWVPPAVPRQQEEEEEEEALAPAARGVSPSCGHATSAGGGGGGRLPPGRLPGGPLPLCHVSRRRKRKKPRPPTHRQPASDAQLDMSKSCHLQMQPRQHEAKEAW
jgi:hypothetical protein